MVPSAGKAEKLDDKQSAPQKSSVANGLPQPPMFRLDRDQKKKSTIKFEQNLLHGQNHKGPAAAYSLKSAPQLTTFANKVTMCDSSQ